MWRHVVSNFLTLMVVVLVALGSLVGWAKNQYVTPGPLSAPICLEVASSGATFRKVVDDLAERGAITSRYILRTGADYEDKADKLKAGSFLIKAGASMQEIVDAITRSGPSTCGTEVNFRIGVVTSDVVTRELDTATNAFVEVGRFEVAEEALPQQYLDIAERPDVRFRVTMAEGVTSWQVVEALRRAEFMTGEIKEIPPEGTLAPDSYEVVRGSDRATLLADMQERQNRILVELWAARSPALPYETPEEALIIASIVEKETGVPEERRRVASVFINRLVQGMKLQTDPTVIYGVTKGQGVLTRGLRQSELRASTPYNTYVIDGLPPTPIANPGRASIEAALNPDQTDYLFFVADGTGGHAFAETLDQHNENVAKWRAIEASRPVEP